MLKPSKVLALCAALLATATIATAEDTPAAAPAVTSVTVPLQGLTKENAPKVETTLKELKHTIFRCPECGMTADAKGNCPDCEKVLKAEHSADALLRSVVVDTAKGLVTFTVAATDGVRLTELETALGATGVTVNRAAVAVLPYSRLVVSGVDAMHPEKLVQGVIAAMKSYETLTVATDDDTKLTTVTLIGGKGASLAALTEVVTKAGFKVADVTWTAPCAACAKKGMTHGGCPACMGDRT
jgi:hypothetical protein